jgi:hypothetical protein
MEKIEMTHCQQCFYGRDSINSAMVLINPIQACEKEGKKKKSSTYSNSTYEIWLKNHFYFNFDHVELWKLKY